MARGIAAAVAATVTAAASHTFAGAEAPSPAVLALAVAFAVMLCVFLAGRSLSLPRLAASVLLSQFGYHALFLVTGSAGEVSVVGAGAHLHGGSTLELVSGGGGHAAHTPAMFAAHAAAAVFTIVALRHGERTFWTLGAGLERVVVRIVARASALISPTGPSIAVLGAPEPYVLRPLDTALSVLRRRGPPARSSRRLS